MDGQMTIFDFAVHEARPTQDTFTEAYKTFHEHCRNRGWLKGATETEPQMWMCGFANRKDAKCWADWIPCTCENCPLKN